MAKRERTPAQTALMLLRDLNKTRRTGDDFQGPLVEELLHEHDLSRGYDDRFLKIDRMQQRIARASARKGKKT